MNRSFLHLHLKAWLGAIAFAGLGSILVGLAPPNLVLFHPPIGIPFLLAVSVIALLFTKRAAALLAPCELLMVLFVFTSTALSFGLSYAGDISTFLPDDGHTFFDAITFGSRPFDFWGQFRIFAFFLIWSAAMVWLGIFFTRRKQHSPSPLPAINPGTQSKVWSWLAFDFLLIACVTIALLHIRIVDQIAKGQPDYLIHTLQSPTASEGERLQAVWKLSRIHTDQANHALQQASHDSLPSVQMAAVGALLTRNDISVLPQFVEALNRPNSGNSALQYANCLNYIEDPAAVPSLVLLMDSPDANVRRGASHALRNIHSAASIDTLVKGLDDNDVEVRYFCACTLIKAIGNGHYPSRGKYGLHEDAFLSQWKTWANDRSQKPPHTNPL